MMTPNFNTKGLIRFIILLFIISITLIIWWFIGWVSDDKIKSSERIIPELQITVKDNIVDTVYIYREP